MDTHTHTDTHQEVTSFIRLSPPCTTNQIRRALGYIMKDFCETMQDKATAYLRLGYNHNIEYPPPPPPPTHSLTSICILRCDLKEESNMRKMFRDNSNTWGTLETPFLPKATQRYCLMAEMKLSSVRKTGPEF